jgi:hypothetical protein
MFHCHSERGRALNELTRVAITVEAFEVIRATLPVGSVMYEPQTNAKGERMIWLEEKWHNQLGLMRGPGESYSDVILRLAAVEHE